MPRSLKKLAQPATKVAGIAPEIKTGTGNATQTNRMLDKNNPYLQTILHPAEVFGVKIPDGCYDQSATVTEYTRYQFNGGSAGYRCVLLGLTETDGSATVTARGSLVPGYEEVTGAGDLPWNLGFIGESTATAADLLWAGAGADSAWIPHPGSTSLNATFRALRLVSCGVRIVCASAPLTAKGWVTVAALPRGYSKQGFFSSVGGSLTLAGVLTLPGSVTVPLNDLGSGLSAIYRPTDNVCLEYAPTRVEVEAATIDEHNFAVHDVGAFVIVCHGTDATTVPPFLIEVVENFEAQPTSNAVLVTSSPSFSDPLALSHALNRAEEVDTVKHSGLGFEGVEDDSHPVSRAVVRMVDVCHEVKSVKGTPQRVTVGSVSGTLATTSFGLTKKASKSNRGLAKQAAGGAPTDTLSTIMDMVLPLAVKFLPEIAAAFL